MKVLAGFSPLLHKAASVMCNLMKKLIFNLLLLIVCSKIQGQENYFSYETIKKDDSFSFPVFSNHTDSLISEKINQFLQLSALNLLKGFENKDVFELVTINDESLEGGMTSISFNVNSSTNKVLSIGFFESSQGATSFYWSKYYNFNSGNGDLIQLKDLFTEVGFKSFAIKVYKQRILHLSKELKKLSKAEREEFKEIFDCYRLDDLNDFYFKDNCIFIDGDNCFRKNLKFSAVERIDSINLNDFKDYLNDYGKCLFSINKDSIGKYRSNELPQLFSGNIAGSKIILVLDGYEDGIFGEYVYLKYGRGISFEGKLENGVLVLTEKNSNFETVGYINAKYDGNQIIGTWTNFDNSKSCKFFVKRK